jgi:hypothetical protein
MVRKSTVLLIIVIFGLMFYAGCDDNDGAGGQGAPTPTPTASPPPGGGVPPPAESAECQLCPCKYFEVPMTADCWASPPRDTDEVSAHSLPPFFDTTSEDDCFVFSGDAFTANGYEPSRSDPMVCVYGTRYSADLCDAPSQQPPEPRDPIKIPITTDEEFDACRSCLEQYVTFLHVRLSDDLGVGVMNGPPFACK